MFDLDQAITEWRQRLSASGSIAPDDLDELEGHLRDKIDNLVQGGTSEARAFKEALEQIGDSDSLSVEFVRSAGDVWMTRLGIINALFVAGLAAYYHFNHTPWNERVHGFTVVGLMFATIWCWRCVASRLPAMPHPRVRKMIGVSIACLAIYGNSWVFPAIIVQYVSGTLAVALWSSYLTFLLLLLGDGIGLSERDRIYLRA